MSGYFRPFAVAKLSGVIAAAFLASACSTNQPIVGERSQETPMEMWGAHQSGGVSAATGAQSAMLMFKVTPGGLKETLSRLGAAYEYKDIYWDKPLNNENWDCKIMSSFWLRGDNFVSMSSQLLAPYSLRMMVHKPDRSLVIQSTTQSNPCYRED